MSEIRNYWALIARAEGRCEVCGAALKFPQLAHRIPQRFRWIRNEILNHPKNIAVVCSLACNDKASISNHPLEIKRLVSEIEKEVRA